MKPQILKISHKNQQKCNSQLYSLYEGFEGKFKTTCQEIATIAEENRNSRSRRFIRRNRGRTTLNTSLQNTLRGNEDFQSEFNKFSNNKWFI